MTDKVEYSLYDNDDSLSPFHRSVFPDGFAYLVSWAQVEGTHVVKVGETWTPRRWRQFVSRGARIELIVRAAHALHIERQVSLALEAHRPRAFNSKQEASLYLGGNGAGWLECFEANPQEVRELMLSICRGEPHAMVQG